ncbi:MAG TPA: hypothetical protein PLE61_07375 [Vicinamibacterales bacterium]|nr:hypothetical protein [Vicinamibacterales bacterium]
MSLSRWWRERHFEREYRRSVKRDLARIGKDYEAKFKALQTGNDFDASMSAYLRECRLPDLRLETLRSRRLQCRADAAGIELPREWWEHDEEHDLWYLTPDGRRQLKRRLTQERIWAVRQWLQVLTPAAALAAGLVGVIIGLLAMWRWP